MWVQIQSIADHAEMKMTEEFLIETADRCKRLARVGRELAANLEDMGNDLMAKAVELDTTRQKTKKDAKRSSATKR
jgi:hypothetical protein